MEGHVGEPCVLSGMGKGQSIFIVENRRADALPDGGGEGGYRGIAQNQDGSFQSRPPELHGFQHGTDAEKGALLFQKPRHLNGSVAVGIGFDNGHNGQSGLFLHRVDIFFNGIQVDDHLSIIIMHANQLISVNSFPFYHRFPQKATVRRFF